MPVDDAEHALDFVGVAIDGGFDSLFWVEEGEPGFLAKVGALAGDLEVEPAEGGVLLFGGGVVKCVGFVVGVDEIFDDGAGLSEG